MLPVKPSLMAWCMEMAARGGWGGRRQTNPRCAAAGSGLPWPRHPECPPGGGLPVRPPGARAAGAARYREALTGIDSLQLPCADSGGNRRGWFVYVVQLPRGVDRDATVRALAQAGVPSKPYFPAVHLMSFYRQRFGHLRPAACGCLRFPLVRGRIRFERNAQH